MKTRSNLLVLAATAILVVAVSWSAWAHNPVTFTTLVDMAIFALPIAGIYAMSATGLVVVNTTTGIFNFAQGAIGMFLAYVDWELTVDHGLPQLLVLPLLNFTVAASLAQASLSAAQTCVTHARRSNIHWLKLSAVI